MFVRICKTIVVAALGFYFIGSTSHLDSPYLLEGCGSCHVGHGMSKQPMLSAAEEDACYQCHGSTEERAKMQSGGRLSANAPLKDMEQVFRKMFRHPVEEMGEHVPGEQLPRQSGAQVNHAECVDCHNPHSRSLDKSVANAGVSGFSLSGEYVDDARYEYEVCFKCHSQIVGRITNRKDMRASFAANVRSQHPVTYATNLGKSVSLKPLSATIGMMDCSDCHSSDDEDDPKGPHGSRYEFILKDNYDRSTRLTEDLNSFALCYGCHDRSSILANESFSLHREHITGNPLNNVAGTSCFTCHASHSSADNLHLIEFNPEAVSRNSSGRLSYISTGQTSGECYLSCHGHDHNPGRY